MTAQDSAPKSRRRYTLGKRAERQAETRRRIVAAAVELHGSVGPAATTFSMVAERAGVQRHTLYAHFPDARSLLLACSGHVQARDPLPDAAAWRDIPDRRARLAAGIGAVHDWYARHAALMACVARDAEHHAPTREIRALRFGPAMAAWLQVLGADLGPTQRALLRLALGFYGWRTLREELDRDAAVAAMVEAIDRGC